MKTTNDFVSESHMQKVMASYLERYFHVRREVPSKDRKSRIDMILWHKSDIEMQYPIGIEVKKDEKKTGRSLGIWLKQCVRYTENHFLETRILVCTYPQVSGQVLEEGRLMSKHNVFVKGSYARQHNVNTFLAQFNIGEMQKYRANSKDRLRIVYNSNCIWDVEGDHFRPENYPKL